MKKTVLIPALALAASALAAPAMAQSYGTVTIGVGQPYGYQQPYYGDRDYRGGRYDDRYGGRYDDHRGWQPVSVRFRNLDRRIDVGVRNGQLSRREAVRLRAEFNQLVRLEASYSRNGLNAWERADLDRRFDRLSAQIRYERRDRDGRRW